MTADLFGHAIDLRNVLIWQQVADDKKLNTYYAKAVYLNGTEHHTVANNYFAATRQYALFNLIDPFYSR